MTYKLLLKTRTLIKDAIKPKRIKVIDKVSGKQNFSYILIKDYINKHEKGLV